MQYEFTKFCEPMLYSNLQGRNFQAHSSVAVKM